MTISKADQIDKDYRYVTNRRPWLLPVSWVTPGPLADYTASAAKERNARLKDAYRHRKRRAEARAKAVVEATTREVGTFSKTKVSSGVPKVINAELPRGWRSRELRGHRAAPGHIERIRKQETSKRRTKLRNTPRSEWMSDWTSDWTLEPE